MPSSTLVACRASVMLGSLVAVPAAALFWPSFPTTVDSLWASVRPQQPEAVAYATENGAISRQELVEAPRFEPLATQGPLDFAQPSQSPTRSANRSQGFGLPTGGASSFMGTAADSAAKAHPLARSEQPALVPVGGAGASNLSAVRRDRAMQASFSDAAVGQRGASTHPTSMRAPASRGEAPRFEGQSVEQSNNATADALSRLQGELRRRGVTYSLLESWGEDANEYRFHCKVAVAGNTRYYRNFESVSADPLSAMRQVLSQIEAWQSGQSF